jgi:hypothetical protein
MSKGQWTKNISKFLLDTILMVNHQRPLWYDVKLSLDEEFGISLF